MISAPRTDESPAAGGDPVEKSRASSPLVAIGASAGGLEALKDLFSNVPVDTGAAFVVITHLDPNSQSFIAQILGRCTTMPVAQVQEGMLVEANQVYVIPPKASLTLSDSTFHLKEPVLTHGLRMPIDTFLLSLSEDQQEKTVAVILSGSGTDGTLGLRAIKGHGGLAMAQSPESAQYDGMPRSAIATGLVDIVSPVKAMVASLDRFLHHQFAGNVGKRTFPTRLPHAPTLPADQLQAGELIRHELLSLYAPAAVLVDQKHHVLYFYGATAAYLDQPDGAPTQALLSLVRQELRPTLSQALRQAAAASRPTVVAEAHLARNKALVPVNITVRPVGDAAVMFLVTFQELSAEAIVPKKKKRFAANDQTDLILKLEQDLKVTREELQKSVEERESVTAELRAAHEEVLSANEELLTVNRRLKNKFDELTAAKDDLANLLSSTDIATLFIDRAFNLRLFTPAATKVLDLTQSSIGQPIAAARAKFTGTDLVADARRVLETLTAVEHEVSSETQAHYICRVLPFRTADRRVGGVVITFIDITEQKQSVRSIRRLADLVRDSSDAITVQDSRGRIVAWNQGAERTYGWSEREALSMNMTEIVPEDMRANERQQIEKLLRGESVPSFETERLTRGGRRLDVWSTMTCLTDEPSGEKLIATTDLAMQGESLQNMSRLLSSLLDITKLESGSIRPMLVDFPIRQVFEHLKATFLGEASEKGLDLRIVATDSIAHSDPILLTQLLQHLVANAVRYTQKGFVEVRCIRRDTQLRCEVADSGIGIPGREVKSVLGKLDEIGDDRHERKGGLGLGLAIVQRIAQLLDMHVEVQSVTGCGSTFSLDVPIGADVNAPAEGKPDERMTPVVAYTLLLVGENGAILAAAKMLQKVKGFTVLSAPSAAEAATRLRGLAAAPDLIITESRLGQGESGLDVIRAARARAGYVIPAIVLAGDSSPKISEGSMAHLQTLRKPIDEDDLMAAIGSALAPRH